MESKIHSIARKIPGNALDEAVVPESRGEVTDESPCGAALASCHRVCRSGTIPQIDKGPLAGAFETRARRGVSWHLDRGSSLIPAVRRHAHPDHQTA